MRKIWIVRYEAFLDSHEERFNSFEEAKLFARETIVKHHKMSEVIEDIRIGRRKKFRAALSDFLQRFHSDPLFPYDKSDYPSDDPDDYDEDIPDDIVFGEDLDYGDTDYDYYSPEDYLEEDDTEREIELLWDINDMFFMDDEDEIYIYDTPLLYVKLYPRTLTGGSSNPLIVLAALRKRTLDPESYDPSNFEPDEPEPLSPRTAYRHIKLLSDLGYVLKRNEHGFTLVGKTAPKKHIKFGTSAYPVMLLEALESADRPLTQGEIIDEIKERYNGTVIHRKAIGRLIGGLIELGCEIEHTKAGYRLTKTLIRVI